MPLKLSYLLCAAVFLTGVPQVVAAEKDTATKLEQLINKQNLLKQESDALKAEINKAKQEGRASETPQDIFAKNQKAKIAAAQAKKEALSKIPEKAKETETKTQSVSFAKSSDDVDLFGDTTKKKATPKATEPKDDALYPFQRKPVYTVPEKKVPTQKKGRRPFIRSELSSGGEEVLYAVVHNQEKLSFAKEEAAGAYVGTTEQNIYVFSDNIANYCELSAEDATKNKNAKKCLDKIIKLQASSKQSDKRTAKELVSSSFMDDNLNYYATAVEHKVTASGFEENVLIPSQEEFQKSTTERGDLQNLTLMAMEQTKTLNRISDVYSTLLSLEAFKNFSNFEINSKEITDIEQEYEAQNSDK